MLVDPAWLAARVDDPGLVVVDVRWREDGSGRARFDAGHIPGAVFMDWASDLVDAEHPVAFMLAPADRLAEVMERVGIGDDTVVVAYADGGGSGPFRLWWAHRVYGHDDVHILDGGLERWIAEGHPLTASRPPAARSRRPAPPVRWRSRPGEPVVAVAQDVAAAQGRADVAVLDSRPSSQFSGEAVWFETGAVPAGPDGVAHTPRGDLRAGRVPWAANVPAATLYRPDGTMKDPAELRTLFAEAGVDVATVTRAITYCGVGISAAALAFALERAGVPDVALYDASWEEWGREPARPVARG